MEEKNDEDQDVTPGETDPSKNWILLFFYQNTKNITIK